MIETTTRARRGPQRGVARSTTAEDILNAAERIFAELGFAGASLDDIADAVGIRRPSVLHHFRSKRAIYDAVEGRIFEELDRRGAARDAGLAPAEALWALLDTWLQFMIARPHAARIIARNSADLVSRTEGNPTLFSESAVFAFDEILRDGIAKGVFRDVKPALALNIIGSAIPAYVCNAEQLGKGRGYTADAPETLQSFREMLQAALRGILIA